MRVPDRIFYAGLVPVAAILFAVVFATIRPAPVEQPTDAITHLDVTVYVVPTFILPTPIPPTETPGPRPTRTKRATWEPETTTTPGRIYRVPAWTPTPVQPKPEPTMIDCRKVTPDAYSDIPCEIPV